MFLAVSVVPGFADNAAPVLPLVAHHANYKLSLVKASGAKAPEAVDGLMSYDFTGSACDGYAMTLRQMTALQPQEGEARVSDMQTASFEDGAARDYRFKVATKGDAGPDADIDGSAHRGSNGVISVALDQPDTEKLNLDAGVLFPTEHLIKIIATARDGGKLVSANVFDGSDTGKKVFSTLTVIGALNTTAAPEEAAKALTGIRHWPVTISYFDVAKADGAPDYVLSFDLYENGISRALRLDYGDFVLAGELTDLKVMPETACTK
jgi:hypothetical protein